MAFGAIIGALGKVVGGAAKGGGGKLGSMLGGNGGGDGGGGAVSKFRRSNQEGMQNNFGGNSDPEGGNPLHYQTHSKPAKDSTKRSSKMTLHHRGR